MTLSYVQYVADGTVSEFDVPFPFANRTHVKVTINGVPPVLPIRWIGENRIKIADNIASGSVVEVRRDTPLSTRLVDFQNGSVLTEEELDLAINQVFFLQQELNDKYDRGLGNALTRVATNGGITTVDPNAVVEELANLVIEEEVLADFRQAISDIGLNAESITAQALDISDINTTVDQLTASSNAAIATVDGKVGTLRADHEQLVALVDALAGGDPGSGIATLIQDETNARIAGDTAIVDTLAIIGAKSGDGLAFILDMNKVKVSSSETLSQRLTALSATDSSNAAAIISEQNARVSADNALSTSITGLIARADTNEAAIISEQTARANADSALTTSLNALTSRVGTAESAIVTEQNTRASADSALTTSLNTLTSRVGAAESAITTEQTTRANADSAFASTLSLIGAKNAGSTAFVINTATTQIGGGETLATRFSSLSTADSNNLAAIQSEQTARINADSVLTSSVNSLGSRMGTAEAAIVTEQNARIAGDAAEASARAALAARVTSAEAAITSEQTARASADSAFASDLALLGAKNAGGTAWVLDLNKVQVSAGTSLGTRLSGIDTAVGNNSAAIVNEQNARTSADNALSSSITTLTSTVNGNTASISTLQSSVNGLSAKYGVSLDVNGYVTGFVQNNNGTSGTFTIVADKFAIVQPGSAPYVPFEVSGGVTRIKEAAIGSLSVGKLTGGSLGAAITQNADWTVGTGRIIWDNGSFMKVSGVGFGTSNQFIEWFGPKMAISACSESNAIQYLKTNGDAYFGGSLSAGSLINRGQTTIIGTGAEITVGPFGTNGNAKSVVVSFVYSRSYRCNAGTGAIGSGGSTTVVIEKDTGSGWTQIGTMTANTTTATVEVDGDPTVKDQVLYRQSASTTITDNSAAGTMSIRARVTSQTIPTLSGTSITQSTTSQTLGVVSTE